MQGKIKSSQMVMLNSVVALPKKEIDKLKNSWAGVFHELVFSSINADIFADLYSDNPATRPGVDVRILVSALIIKALFRETYEELVNHFTYDLQYKYAIHCDNLQGAPFCEKTLRNFKAKVEAYEKKNGVNLLELCFSDQAEVYLKVMKVNTKKTRMDSMMIESPARFLSRPQLFYETIYRAVRYLFNNQVRFKELPQELRHYLQKDDLNQCFYHKKGSYEPERFIKEALSCYNFFPEAFRNSQDYLNLERLIKEQLIQDENQNYRLRENKSEGLNSETMQTPVDPDCTFRSKKGAHIGYSLNFQEAPGENTSLIMDAQFEKNTYSDEKFMQDWLGRQSDSAQTIVTDGAYGSVENIQQAELKNIELIPTNLIGRSTDPIQRKTVLNEEETTVLKCPAGFAPKSCTKTPSGFNYSMKIEYCRDCPYRNQCHPRVNKNSKNPRTCRIITSKKSIIRGQLLYDRQINPEEFKEYSDFRNGVESIPSLMRNYLQLDRLKVYGFVKTKMEVFIMLMALNTRKLIRYQKNLF